MWVELYRLIEAQVVKAMVQFGVTILGYPVLNDYLYNSYLWGPSKGKNADFGKSTDQVNIASVY